MTFNNNADVGGNTARRGGGRGGLVIGGGLAGLGGLAILLLNLFTGGDVGSLLGGLEAPQPSEGTAIAQCDTGADANANDDCRLAASQLILDGYWEQRVRDYRAPQLIIVDGSQSTSCGTASHATGPFYCPPDETVYIDPTFFAVLRTQFGAQAGPLAQLYVLGHEWGHHIQQITGVMERFANDGTGPTSNGVRTELQADCYAGAWLKDASSVTDPKGVAYLQRPTDAQLRDALNAAASVGDDNIQAQSGAVRPETWTHGSSAQRQRWFTSGYQNGLGACDTFSVSGGEL
ncbi:neutral zinc metallopeptidase [Microbacterium sp. VKM Ac-2870]|jgi:predicted metalloprotease|uniref:KPN_02809 family neutral zinc metallopeptidase n=1 Tax=Microbacterium sp. VKM Ac-2870 TaxID=2783825 RepID=UPI00188A85D6|nr:neutral zinc metallopeptidase [Microbacterium sp. VKM Ac-2870]MBF4562761.1 neutral zinc metallopeptidase [Microbacterium sp. VKM Ac-2870]